MTYLRKIRTLILSLAVCGVFLSAASAKDVSMNFIANATVRITDGEYILFTDFPYVSGAFEHMDYQYPFFVEQDNNVTTLITSRMADHFDPDIFMTLGWKIIAPNEVVSGIEERYIDLNIARDKAVADLELNRKIDQALKPDLVITVTLPDPIIKPKVIAMKKTINHGPMKITSIETESAQTEHYSYILEWADKKMYFSGDTGDVTHLSALPEVDIAFISPWLFENARKENALPNAKKIVIYQHKDNEIIPNCFDCIVPVKGEYIPFD